MLTYGHTYVRAHTHACVSMCMYVHIQTQPVAFAPILVLNKATERILMAEKVEGRLDTE